MLHGGEGGHAPLAPGQQPAAPEPRSLIREENGWRYEYVAHWQCKFMATESEC
jgi:hypothetical protein